MEPPIKAAPCHHDAPNALMPEGTKHRLRVFQNLKVYFYIYSLIGVRAIFPKNKTGSSPSPAQAIADEPLVSEVPLSIRNRPESAPWLHS